MVGQISFVIHGKSNLLTKTRANNSWNRSKNKFRISRPEVLMPLPVELSNILFLEYPSREKIVTGGQIPCRIGELDDPEGNPVAQDLSDCSCIEGLPSTNFLLPIVEGILEIQRIRYGTPHRERRNGFSVLHEIWVEQDPARVGGTPPFKLEAP